MEKKSGEIEVRTSKELEKGCYSNYAVISHSLREFHLVFAQTAMPGRVPVEKIGYVNAVAHIIVPPSVMPGIIKAMSENYEAYKKHQAEADKTES